MISTPIKRSETEYEARVLLMINVMPMAMIYPI